MSSGNGPDATYASVQEEIIGFAGCPTLSTIVPPPPAATSFAPVGASQRSLGDQQQGTMIRSEVTGNLEIHDREFVMKVRRSVSTRYLANKQRQMKQIYYNWECSNALSYE